MTPLPLRLLAHFQRMEKERGWPIRAYQPTVAVRGDKVILQPIAFRPATTLSMQDAERLADWLDQGVSLGFWALMMREKDTHVYL